MPGSSPLAFDPIERAGRLWQEHWPDEPSEVFDAMRAVTSVMRAHQILLADLDARLRPYGITFSRYEALVLLAFSRSGALPLSRIGERLQVHATSVTNVIDRLEAAGLVRREPNPRDGRGTLAVITDEGRAVAERATHDLNAGRFGLAPLDPDDLVQLFRVLRRLRVHAGDYVVEGDAEGEAVEGEAVDGAVAGAGSDEPAAGGAQPGRATPAP